MNSELHSLNFSGMGKCSGGEFDRVNISGTGKIQGNIKCSKFDASGMAKVFGDVESEKFNTSGVSKIEGNLYSKEIDVSGVLKCTGEASSNEVRVSGMATVEQSLKSHRIEGEGCLTVKGDIECEQVDVYGMIDCRGFLNCENLELGLVGTSNINEVGASNIKIENGKSNSIGIFNVFTPAKYKNNKLVANIIEGDDIVLENCEAKFVRGKNIKIGENCKINTVEYSGNIEVDKKSKIENINKV